MTRYKLVALAAFLAALPVLATEHILRVEVDPLTKLIKLVAAHGVYALAVLFLFHLRSRTKKEIDDAKPEDRPFFKKLHVSTVVAVYVLVLLASGVWIYGTFVYHPRVVVEGTAKDLWFQSVEPKSPLDAPYRVQQLAAFRNDLDFYTREMPTLDINRRDLGWILVGHREFDSLRLIFRQHCKIMHPGQTSDGLAHASDRPFREPILTGEVQIDLAQLEALGRERIYLRYEENTEAPNERLGRLLLVVDGKNQPLPWIPSSQIATHPTSRRRFDFRLGGEAIAAPAPKQPPVAQVRSSLSASDLERQLLGQRAVLASSQPAALLQALLNDQEQERTDGSLLLLHNLSAVINRLNGENRLSDLSLDATIAKKLYAAGDYLSAIPHLERLRGTAYENKPSMFRLAVAHYKAKNYGASAAAGERLLEQEMSSADRSVVLSNLALAELQLGRQAAAERHLNEAIRLSPTYSSARTNLGFLYLRTGDLDRAEPLLQRGGGDDAEAYYGLGVLHRRREQDAAAIAAYERALAVAPDHISALNNLAYTYAEQGENLELALELIDRAIQLGGETAARLDTRGWVLFHMGRREEAQRELKRAAMKDPRNPTIRSHLAATSSRVP